VYGGNRLPLPNGGAIVIWGKHDLQKRRRRPIPVILETGFVVVGVPSFWQTTTIGAVLVMAVALDRKQRRSVAATYI
jgi:hypothetical protein